MTHLALDRPREVRHIPVNGRLGQNKNFFLEVKQPSFAKLSDNTNWLWAIHPTSVTKQEIELDFQYWQQEKNARTTVWRANLSNPSADGSVDAISDTVDSLLEAIEFGGPSLVKLDNLNFEFINAEHLIAILRTTFTWKEEVPGWRAALNAAPAILEKQGLNPSEELFGLDSII